MKIHVLCLTALLCLSTQLSAQTVQLPQFHLFGTSTTVLVPDRGSVLLGSVNRASSGRVEFGNPLGRNVATGSDQSAANVRVSVYIHDFDAMDEALLGMATGRQMDGRAVAARPRAQVERAGAAALASVAEIRRGRAAESEDKEAEAQRFFDQAQAAEAAGKKGLARQYYQMASRRATGRLHDRALARAEALPARGLATASAR